MAAYNFHRKIVEEICSFDCDAVQNPTRKCLPMCSLTCPSNCDAFPPLQSSPEPPSTGDYIFIAPPSKHHHSSLSLTLKISLGILVVTFSFFLLYTLYKFYCVWYRSRSRSSRRSTPENQERHDEFLDQDVVDHPIWYIRTIGLQPSVINAISVVKYTKSDGLIEGTDCSVCLSDFQEDDMLRLLPKCNHAFHISCIDTWLRSHTNCPLCRAGIVKNATLDQNLDDLEDTQVAISINDEVVGDETQSQDDDDRSFDLRSGVVDEEENKGEMVGGSETNDILIIRRSVSLNDFADCRIIRSDVHNINYYSDRHDVQIQSVNGDSVLETIKVDQTTNKSSPEED